MCVIVYCSRSLIWEKVVITDSYGEQLAKLCPHLQSITLKNLRKASGFNHFFQNLQQSRLTAINIDCADELDLEVVIRSSPKLQRLACETLTINSQLIDMLPRDLHELKIEINELYKKPVIESLVRLCNLQTLCIKNCVIEDDDIKQLKALKNLQSLSITCSSKILVTIARHLPQLQQIEFYPKFDSSQATNYDATCCFEFIKEIHKRVTSITLHNCNLNDTFWLSLAENGIFLDNLVKLDIDFSARHVSDATIDKFFTRSSRLRKFSMSQTKITNAGFDLLLTKLHKLNCVEITFSSELSGSYVMAKLINYANKHNNRKIFGRIPIDYNNNFSTVNVHRIPSNLTIYSSTFCGQ